MGNVVPSLEKPQTSVMRSLDDFFDCKLVAYAKHWKNDDIFGQLYAYTDKRCDAVRVVETLRQNAVGLRFGEALGRTFVEYSAADSTASVQRSAYVLEIGCSTSVEFVSAQFLVFSDNGENDWFVAQLVPN